MKQKLTRICSLILCALIILNTGFINVRATSIETDTNTNENIDESTVDNIDEILEDITQLENETTETNNDLNSLTDESEILPMEVASGRIGYSLSLGSAQFKRDSLIFTGSYDYNNDKRDAFILIGEEDDRINIFANGFTNADHAFKYLHQDSSDSGDYTNITTAIPETTEDYTFLCWYNKRGDSYSSILLPGDPLLKDDLPEQTVDAVWGYLEGNDSTFIYDGQAHSITVPTIKLNGEDGKYSFQDVMTSYFSEADIYAVITYTDIFGNTQEDFAEVRAVDFDGTGLTFEHGFIDAGTYTYTVIANFEIRNNLGGRRIYIHETYTLNILPRPLILTCNSSQAEYDGLPKTVESSNTFGKYYDIIDAPIENNNFSNDVLMSLQQTINNVYSTVYLSGLNIKSKTTNETLVTYTSSECSLTSRNDIDDSQFLNKNADVVYDEEENQILPGNYIVTFKNPDDLYLNQTIKTDYLIIVRDGSLEITGEVINDWGIEIYKYSESISDNTLLPGAIFGLYSSNQTDAIDTAIIETWKFSNDILTYDFDDTTWYLCDIAKTKNDGKIIDWNSELSRSKYIIRELRAPDGYMQISENDNRFLITYEMYLEYILNHPEDDVYKLSIINSKGSQLPGMQLDPVSIELILQKTVQMNATASTFDNDIFSFMIVPDKDNDPWYDPISIKGQKIDLVIDETLSNSVNIFDELFFDEGIYKYNIYEIQGENENIIYDTTQYNVIINVESIIIEVPGRLGSTYETVLQANIDVVETEDNKISFVNNYISEDSGEDPIIPDPDNTKEVTVTITAEKKLIGEALVGNDFEFELVPVDQTLSYWVDVTIYTYLYGGTGEVGDIPGEGPSIFSNNISTLSASRAIPVTFVGPDGNGNTVYHGVLDGFQDGDEWTVDWGGWTSYASDMKGTLNGHNLYVIGIISINFGQPYGYMYWYTENGQEDPQQTLPDPDIVYNDSEGNISFEKIYTKPGVYTYKLHEIIGDREDVIYDYTEYDVVVTVSYAEDNETLVATVEFYKDGVSVDSLEFINEVEKTELPDNSLTITKTVTGSLGSHTKQFDFELIFSNETEIPQSVTVTKNEVSEEVLVIDNKISFTLANKENIIISGIPNSATITIKEIVDGYETYMTYDDIKNNGQELTLVIDSDMLIDVVNSRDGLIPTNIYFKTYLFNYILLFGVSLSILLVTKYKHHDLFNNTRKRRT